MGTDTYNYSLPGAGPVYHHHHHRHRHHHHHGSDNSDIVRPVSSGQLQQGQGSGWASRVCSVGLLLVATCAGWRPVNMLVHWY